MIKKILIFLAVFVVTSWATLKWGDPSGVIRGVESLLRPVVQKEIINRYCGLYKEDPYFIMSIMKVESNFLRGAKSRRGARGLMQLMPATAQEIAQELRMKDYQEKMLDHPDVNIQFGVYYVAKLRKDLGDDDRTVLAAYNAGRKNVQDWLSGSKKKFLETGDIDFIETRNFVEDVLWNYHWVKRWQKFRGKLITKAKEVS